MAQFSAGISARSFWIVNALAVHGDSQLAQWMANQPAVALVAANIQHPLEVNPAEASQAGNAAPAWGVSQIGAPSVWADWGVRGAGITVANLDTGVAYTHTALLEQYRGWSNGSVDNNYNWYDSAGDPAGLTPAPGASAHLNAVLSGYDYAAWHPGPSAGVLRLFTNDPGQSIVDIPAAAQVGPAPYQTNLASNFL